MRKTAFVVVFAVIGITSTALAQSPETDDKWTFAVQPYLWLVGVDGTLKYDIPSDGGGGADVGLTLEDLKFAFMMSAEARTGNWAILTDLVYADIESNNDSVQSVRFPESGGQVEVAVDEDSETSSSIVATEWTLAGAYTVARGGKSSLEVLAGVRYLSVEAKSEWQLEGQIAGPGPGQSFDREGSASKRANLWDGVLGVRGELGLGGSWFIPYYGDIGAGTSAMTWQAMAGLGYRFKGWSVGLHYRYLHYDMKESELLQDVSFPGGAVSAKFRF